MPKNIRYTLLSLRDLAASIGPFALLTIALQAQAIDRYDFANGAPAIGATLVVGLQYYLDAFGGWVTLVTGLIFMVCVLSFRSGIAGAVQALRPRPRNER